MTPRNPRSGNAARAAAIDIGTNTVLLTIAERDQGGALRPVVEQTRIPRLGEGVDRSRRLAPEACRRTLSALADYAAEVAHAGVARDRVALVGTSALRDAEGASSFVDAITEMFGVRPRILDGREEAELTFIGGLSGLDLDGPVLVFDVGGGSTEIVFGKVDATTRVIESAESLDLGSVRLFERLVRNDPATSEELSLARQTIRAELRRLPDPPEATVVGVAGTVATLAALALGVSSSRLGELHGVRVTHTAVRHWASRLAHSSLAERQKLGGIEPGRADVIAVGAAIVDEILGWANTSSLVTSDRGVRWGVLERLLAEMDRRS